MHDTLTLVPGVWTLLTTSNITKARIQPLNDGLLAVQATVGAVPPSSEAGALYLSALSVMLGYTTVMAEAFEGVPGANRFYGLAKKEMQVSVSHA